MGRSTNSVRKRDALERLQGWIRFIQGEQDSAPDVGLAFTRGPALANQLRKQAGNILRTIAIENGQADRLHQQPLSRQAMAIVEWPALPRRLMITSDTVKIMNGTMPLDALISALQHGAGLLRICQCNGLFLQFPAQKQTCSNRCRQQRHYWKDPVAERKRQLKRYREQRAWTKKHGKPPSLRALRGMSRNHSLS